MLCILTAYALRGSLATGTPVVYSGFDGITVIAGFIMFVAAASVFGTAFGVSLILSCLLHELGHFLAHRMLGHSATRFRLAPILTREPSSDTPLTTEAQAFFVALMGPGLCLAPVAFAMTSSFALADIAPVTADYLVIFAVTCGAFNFVNLLPFFPLDGGRCARIAANNFWPALAPAMTVFMAAAFASASIRLGSVSLMVMAGIGAHSLLRRSEDQLVPMGGDRALVGLTAYSFTLAAHFTAGWTLYDAYY